MWVSPPVSSLPSLASSRPLAVVPARYSPMRGKPETWKKSFLGQQDIAAGLLRHLSENGQILPQALSSTT